MAFCYCKNSCSQPSFIELPLSLLTFSVTEAQVCAVEVYTRLIYTSVGPLFA